MAPTISLKNSPILYQQVEEATKAPAIHYTPMSEGLTKLLGP